MISGIAGFKAHYVLKLAEGTSTVSVFDSQGAEESNRAAAGRLKENVP